MGEQERDIAAIRKSIDKQPGKKRTQSPILILLDKRMKDRLEVTDENPSISIKMPRRIQTVIVGPDYPGNISTVMDYATRIQTDG